jgi:2'-deoxynucleoside 5'-phosphate N-hydrolase
MKTVYFAGSISGGREDSPIYARLLAAMRESGLEVLGEHVGDVALTSRGEALSSSSIHDRDLGWIRAAEGVIAEVTRPSLGVGYEVAYATHVLAKPVLALFRGGSGRRLSAMVEGAPGCRVVRYESPEEAIAAIERFTRFTRSGGSQG